MSTAGGEGPQWRGDGREIFYLQLDGTLMAAQVEAGASGFAVRRVQPLFRTSLSAITGWTYDVSADGERFLMTSNLDDVSVAPLHLVFDWTALLEQR